MDIPPAWVPGRDSFIRMQLSSERRYQFEHFILYAEIAASVAIWYAQRKDSFEPISYKDLNRLNSQEIIVQNPSGLAYTTSRLMLGIKVLIELGLAENDKTKGVIEVREVLLDHIRLCDLVCLSNPCA